MDFLKYSKIYFTIAVILILGSLFSLFYFGLNLGIDFEGGSSLSIEYKTERPDVAEIKEALTQVKDLQGVEVQPVGQSGVIVKINKKDISSETYESIISELKKTGDIEESSAGIETISPLIGKELKQKTIVVVVVSLLAMLAYIALAFRNVSRPITSFQYGFSSTLMLFHDIVIPLGALAILGHFYGAQLTIPVVTALLTIVGYCINNNVVVFDRIRENLLKNRGMSYEEIVNKSLNETFARCVNTSLTVLFALGALYYFFGSEEGLKYFTLTAGIGVFVGIFSSVFLASPLLVYWLKFKKKKV
ncbi:MAG: protein translocase subunit SecF [Candidatus Paceibacterota bacterium]|jgi:preprotein translocase subunit SecF|nr:protein translocase subunit SecF [Candidatus Paceibacterota bacterium]MDD5555256.1 protein translocase subunit SecF [Candidatus Paceibacterota bacterium]